MSSNIQQLVSVIEENKANFEILLDLELNYKPQSLKKLEEAMISMFGSRGIQPTTAIFLGAYVGEVIVKNVKGAEWVDFVEDPFDATVSIQSKSGHIEVKPLIRVHKFSLDHTDGLYPFYAMVQDFVNGRLGSGEDFSKGPVTEGISPRGYQYKTTRVSPALAQRYNKGEITQQEMMDLAKKEADAENKE